MISSPCKECENKNLPKDECLTTCKLIQAIQALAMSRWESNVYSAVDCSEESRFQVAWPSAGALSVC